MNDDDTTRALPDDDTTRPLPDAEGEPAWQPPPVPAEEEPGGRHPLRVTYLVAGLIFLGVAVSWLLREAGAVDAGSGAWFFPLTLVVAGTAGLAAWLTSTARHGNGRGA